ncbi:unnamed protein product [Caenorhabditis auriculariae]|uniref:Uncharacterized protein n=1 Tax=Caenorhabditis auriculariae TaxID=2777116 RepID=A0A8S1HRK5_9PELO|nr:unnamed protein product [Caenorhabditis auriculariae]
MKLALVAVMALNSFVFWFWYSQKKNLAETAGAANLRPFDYLEKFNNMTEIMNNTCVWPLLSPAQQEIKIFIGGCKPITCPTDMSNMAQLSLDGILTISHDIISRRISDRNPNFNCYYLDLVQSWAWTIVKSKEEILIEPDVPTKVPFEQFLVICKDPFGNYIYEKSFVNFAARSSNSTETELREGDLKAADPESPSLIILALRGVSHNQIMRRLPKSLQFMNDNGFISAAMFNQISQDNDENLMASIGDGDADGIWSKMRERGCVTFLHDDIQGGAPFGSNVTKELDFDFHTRIYHSYNLDRLIRPPFVGHCMADGKDYLDVWHRFSAKFQDFCHFSIAYFSGIGAYDDCSLGAMDRLLVQTFEKFKSNGLMNTTAIVLLTDGGNSKSDFSATITGSVEMRHGAFLIRLPEGFAMKFPEKARNLKINSNRLMSNWDVYATLLDLNSANGETAGSLLSRKLPNDRICSDAGISTDMCLCATEKDTEKQKRKYIIAVDQAIQKEFSTMKCVYGAWVLDTKNLKVFGVRYQSRKGPEFADVLVRVNMHPIKGKSADEKITQLIDFRGRVRIDSNEAEWVGPLIFRNSTIPCEFSGLDSHFSIIMSSVGTFSNERPSLHISGMSLILVLSMTISFCSIYLVVFKSGKTPYRYHLLSYMINSLLIDVWMEIGLLPKPLFPLVGAQFWSPVVMDLGLDKYLAANIFFVLLELCITTIGTCFIHQHDVAAEMVKGTTVGKIRWRIFIVFTVFCSFAIGVVDDFSKLTPLEQQTSIKEYYPYTINLSLDNVILYDYSLNKTCVAPLILFFVPLFGCGFIVLLQVYTLNWFVIFCTYMVAIHGIASNLAMILTTPRFREMVFKFLMILPQNRVHGQGSSIMVLT